MTAGALAASRTGAPARPHASEDAYRSWVEAYVPSRHARLARMCVYRRFTQRWPSLEDWFAEPLPVRLGLPAPA